MISKLKEFLSWFNQGIRNAWRSRRNIRAKKQQQEANIKKIENIYDAQHFPVDEKQVFFEAYHGQGVLCNPEAIFLHMMSRADMVDYTFVWSLKDKGSASAYVQRYSAHSRVKFVETESIEYWKELSTSRIIVNNTSFPHAFRKRQEQIFLNTWHGTPLKTIGYDVVGGRQDLRNVVRNLLMSDFLLSPSPFVTDVMYRKAFKLAPIYQGTVIEDGYPRIDRGLMYGPADPALYDELQRFGVSLDKSVRTVLIAPTWRGGSPFAAKADEIRLLKLYQQVQQSVGSDTKVLLKVHQFVHSQIRDPRLLTCLVDNQVPTNLLLAATDLLITDFSSIFFDYLPLDRPIVFTMDVVDEYLLERGSYIDVEDLPGAVVYDLEELSSPVMSWYSGTYLEQFRATKRSEWASTYTPYEDGESAERIVDHLLQKKKHANLISLSSNAKKRVVIYGGSLGTNGITTSLVNFINALDFSKVDVTLFYGFPKPDFDVDRLDERVRLLPRVGHIIQNKEHGKVRSKMNKTGYGSLSQTERTLLSEIFEEEWSRMTGNSQFDHAIDYSGYAWFWSALIAVVRGAEKSIWIHNDLELESNKVVKGRRPHFQALRGLFSIYQLFDNIISVSPELTRISRGNFQSYAPESKFKTIENLVDETAVKKLAYERFDLVEKAQTTSSKRYDQLNLGHNNASQSVVSFLGNGNSLDELRQELARRRAVNRFVGDEEQFVFVTSGRLSPEKNQERLIRAFAIVKEHAPNTRLLILGNGPLLKELRTLAVRLNVSQYITFALHQPNPHVLVAASDAFVFSSEYEGQGLVILEARILKKPIVSVRFNVVDDVLPKGTGLITEQTVESLAEGMLAVYKGEVPASSFDARAYNENVLADIRSLLLGEDSIERQVATKTLQTLD